jgi:SAM-dependent methyltransferase
VTTSHEAVAKHYERHPYPRYPWFFWGRWKDLEKLDLRGWGIEGKVRETWLCGAGTVQPLLFARRNPRVRFLATDLSQRSLNQARWRCRIFGAWNVHFEKQDLMKMTEEARFCAIDAYGVIHHCESPRRALETLVRALRVGGVLRLMLYSTEVRGEIEQVRAELLKQKRDWSDAELCAELRLRSVDFDGDLKNKSGRADALLHPLVHCFDDKQIENLLEGLALKKISHIKKSNHLLMLKKLHRVS